MRFVKTFENFSAAKTEKIFIANPLAEKCVEEILGVVLEDCSSDATRISETLSSNGFENYRDFLIIDENLAVKYNGHKNGPEGVEIQVDVNGHKYGYSQKEGDLDIGDIARKFEKMLQFSAGRALTWLKKHTVLTSGSKKAEGEEKVTEEVVPFPSAEKALPGKIMKAADKFFDKLGATDSWNATKEKSPAPAEAPDQPDHRYMFFQNLNTIKECLDKILSYSKEDLDTLLRANGDWAVDHIATSKDDIEEVCNWVTGSMEPKSTEPAPEPAPAPAEAVPAAQ